jgi:hypothetical protein
MNEHVSPSSPSLPEAPSVSAAASAPGAALEFFTMKGRLAGARLSRFEPSDPGFRESELGLVALQDARQLGNSRAGRDAALLLYRAAIRLLVRASVLRRAGAGGDEVPCSETWTRAAELPAVSALIQAWGGAPPRWFVDGVTNEHGEIYLAELPGSERARALIEMGALAQGLADPLDADARRVGRLLRVRWLRFIVVALPLALGMIWGLARVTARPNLALHRPVEVTSRDPTYGVDPSHVVDGDESNLGFHTDRGTPHSVTIDLGSVRSLKRVEVFNRADCCEERATPLSVQLSVDGHAYTTVARRSRVFQQWSASLPGGSAGRFVRLVHESNEYFHLSEVEVY